MSRRPTPASRSASASADLASARQDSARQGSARQDSASRDSASRDSASRDSASRDSASRDSASRDSASRETAGQAAPGHGIPDATVARLPVYLRALFALADHGVATVSSEELATAAGVNSAKLRKDLSHLGSYGTRGVGYDVDYLIYQVSRELGLTQDWPVLIVGAGNLGHALANYGGFATRGFRIAAMVDADPAVVGTVIARHTVRDAAELEDVIERFDVSIGVIATPAAAAQDVCDRLVAAGVSSILNFAPVVLSVPSGVDVRKVDLSIELQILAFHAQRRAAVTRQGERGRGVTRAGRRLETVPGGDLGLDVAAELGAGSRLDVAAGLAAVEPPEYGESPYPGTDYPTGVQAVGR